jgi:hypothetical protein
MTDGEFDEYLRKIVNSMTTEQIVGIPGVRTILMEELNNDVLDAWADDNPEKAYPSEGNR